MRLAKHQYVQQIRIVAVQVGMGYVPVRLQQTLTVPLVLFLIAMKPKEQQDSPAMRPVKHQFVQQIRIVAAQVGMESVPVRPLLTRTAHLV